MILNGPNLLKTPIRSLGSITPSVTTYRCGQVKAQTKRKHGLHCRDGRGRETIYGYDAQELNLSLMQIARIRCMSDRGRSLLLCRLLHHTSNSCNTSGEICVGV